MKPNLKDCIECELYQSAIRSAIVEFYSDIESREYRWRKYKEGVAVEVCGVEDRFEVDSSRWKHGARCVRPKGHAEHHISPWSHEDGTSLERWDKTDRQWIGTNFTFADALKIAVDDGFIVEGKDEGEKR